MKRAGIFYSGLLLISVLTMVVFSFKNDEKRISIKVNWVGKQTSFSVEKALQMLKSAGYKVQITDKNPDITLNLKTAAENLPLQEEGYIIRKTPDQKIILTGNGENGVMYGLFDIAEQIIHKSSVGRVEEKTVNPTMQDRFIKFNLPWMSYRKGPALQAHLETCRDTMFWIRFLDMMAVNRFNRLSLWNLHPFTFMVRPENFPKACPFSDGELADWRKFWNTIFRLAKERGIETYIVNWNIFVSPEFAQFYGGADYNKDWGYWGDADRSQLVEKYTREVVTQVINEYPDLTGIGITLGERMGSMTSPERRDWINRTVLAGMRHANRKIKLLYRAPLSAGLSSGGSTSKSTEIITRELLDTLSVASETLIEFKYNWSHGHSADKLFIVHGGKLTDTYWNPVPRNYKIMWTVRNEDFFILRWAQPDFVRSFMANNKKDYISGCIIGSECYIPAKDYISKDFNGKTWDYAFERQWLFYNIWGRLLYDASTSDEVFEKAIEQKFNFGQGKEFLEAYKLASNYYHRFGSFYKGTWDATAYAEAFAGFETHGAKHITLDMLSQADVLDSINYQSIKDYLNSRGKFPKQINPMQLAQICETEAEKVFTIVEEIRSKNKGNTLLDCELTDMETLAHLHNYFACRIKAAVLYAQNKLSKDRELEKETLGLLNQSKEIWQKVTNSAEKYNQSKIPYMFNENFSYRTYLDSIDSEARRLFLE